MAHHFRKDMVIYQIYPRSFLDTDGDGMGDLPGIIRKLDHLQELGVDTVWLSPIYVSPNADNGYDIADYRAIQPAFGTMEDFERLVAEAKKRGIGIVMDLVINHTSDEHEWFRRALAGEEKYKNYYIIAKGKDGKLPNNWGNFFALCPWSKFGDSEDEYYLHLFAEKQPDLNWRNPDVMAEVKDIMRFWLNKGVVGFRCDVINILYKNTLADGKKQLALTGREHYMSTPGCHEILKQLRRDVLDEFQAFAVGETVFVTLQQANDLCAEERGELDMVFSFEHMGCDDIGLKWFKTRLRPKRLQKILVDWQTGVDWNTIYFENHDQPRFISRFDDSAAFRAECSTMMAGLQMTLRGTPFVYQGQEIGMTNGDFAGLHEIQDVESHGVEAMAKGLHIPASIRWKMIARGSRDNGRTPVQWDDSPNAGFTTGTPWLKVNGNYKTLNAKADKADPYGVFAFWKQMIALRKSLPALIDGDFVPVHISDNIFAFERTLNDQRLLSICNMTGNYVRLPKHLAGWDQLVAGNYDDLGDTMRPFEFRLLEERHDL